MKYVVLKCNITTGKETVMHEGSSISDARSFADDLWSGMSWTRKTANEVELRRYDDHDYHVIDVYC